MIKLGINGFGRIGRLASRIILQDYPDKIALTAVNTSGKVDTRGWAYLLKYDTVYGQYPGKIEVAGKAIKADSQQFAVLAVDKPEAIPWDQYGVEVVIESTGKFRTKKDCLSHLKGSVKKVIISAPGKDEIPTFIIGVNEKKLSSEPVISCSSCTTNCVAPVVKVLADNFGIKKALMSTIHAYTSDQELLDGSHRDWRRGRAAAANIIPTSTGAARSTAEVLPEVKGIFDGLALRVPVLSGSLVDLTLVTKKPVTAKQVNQALTLAAKNELRGILGVTEEPLVSSDIIGTKLSCLVDLSLTMVVGGDLVKVICWYDNEWGYAHRLVEEVLLVSR